MRADIKAGGAYVELMLRKKRFQNGLKAAGQHLKTFAKGAALAGAAVATAAAGGIAFGIRQYISLGDEMDKMSKRTGVTVATLSELKHAAIQSGADAAQLEKGFAGLSRTFFDAQRGGKEASDALKAIGLSVRDLDGLSPDQQLGRIADAMGRLESESIRGAVAQRIFGRAGRQLLPMLKEGSKGIGALRDEARDMGLSMSGEAASGAARLLDMLTILGRQGKSVLFEVGAAAAPMLETALPTIQNFAANSIAAIRDMGGFIAGNTAGVTQFLADAWRGYFDLMAPTIGAYVATFRTAFTAIWDVASMAFTGIQDTVSGVLESLTGHTGGVLSWWQETFVGALSTISFGFKNWRVVVDRAILGAMHGVVRFGAETVHLFATVIPGWLSWFGENWWEVFVDVVSITETAATNIWKNLSSLWDGIVSLFNGEGFTFTWTPLTDGFTSAIKELPKIAEREMGPLEQSLANELAALSGAVQDEWTKHQAEFASDVARFTPSNPFGGDAGADGPNAPGAASPDRSGIEVNLGEMRKKVMVGFSAAALTGQSAAGPMKVQKDILQQLKTMDARAREDARKARQPDLLQ